jgi:dihydrofolate reductase
MGDVAEAFAKVNYYGPRFTSVFLEQRSRLMAHEPVLVFVGSCASSAVKQLAENEEYCLWRKSPTLWIGGGVYVRKDHIEDVQRFLMSHAANSQ